MPEFRKRVEAGDIWSLKIPQLKEIIKCLRDSYPSLGVSGNKGDLVDRIQGVFRHQQPRETLQHNKVALKIQRPPIANVASAPYPQRFFVKQNVERKNPLNPISKLVDIVYVHNDISVTFELDPEDHEAVVQRTSRVHVVPLKMNLEPEGWLERDMRLFVNKQWIEVLPKTWRNKNPRVHPFTTVLPLDITTYLSRADRRAEIQVEFPNKQMIWQGLLTVCVVGQRKVKEDDDVEMGDEEISLKCPITLASINIPAKMLRVDALMDSVLKSVNTDVVSKITVKPDGTWTASAACNGATSSNGLHHSASNGSGGAPEPKSGAKSEAVCVDILSDDEDEDDFAAPSRPLASSAPAPAFVSGVQVGINMPAGAPHPVWPPATPHIPTPNGHLPFPSSSAAPLSSIPPPYASSLLPRPPVSAPLYQPASPPAPVSSASATASVSTAPGYYQYAFAAASTGMGMGGGMGTFGSLNVPSFTAASPSYLPSNSHQNGNTFTSNLCNPQSRSSSPDIIVIDDDDSL